MITGNEILERYDDNGDNRYYVIDGVVHMDVFNKYNVSNSDVLYDERFIEYVKPRKWRQVPKSGGVYIATVAKKWESSKHVSLHRFIVSLAGYDIDGKEIDHINGDRFDNRLCNLRVIGHDLQMFNLPPTKRNKFGIRGIGLGDSKVKPYKVSFSRNGVKISSKSFRTLNEAVYVRWRLEEHYWDKIAVSRHFDSFAPYINQLSTDQQSDADEYLKQVFEKYDKVFPGFLPEKE